MTHRSGNTRETELIAATLEAIADEGIAGLTVRGIAERAGVTNGLIRFYFGGKDGLLRAAYRHFLDGLLETADNALARRDLTAGERLAAFVDANLRAPIVAPETVLVWAHFLPLAHRDPEMATIRDDAYSRTTGRLAPLIAAALAEAGRPCPEADIRRLAISVNALIDGLWLEGALSPAPSAREPAGAPVRDLGLAAAGRLVGLSLQVPTESAP
ncbi:TetR family transcriptional regulator C-terminal domain-containing protein [Stappia sp.]|uniref:TetR family transcriptional regulator C-terminal domain-containing protein n=1 Tax=Stappia sp. TaxID=1870903 RepID=UPI0032D8CBC4